MSYPFKKNSPGGAGKHKRKKILLENTKMCDDVRDMFSNAMG